MSDLNVFKQPKAFYLIFSIEFWERFGFYGMQAILTVYLVQILGMSEGTSFVLFGAFNALIYGLVCGGGWVGDKILGTKRTLTLGAIFLAVGYVFLGLSTTDVFSSNTIIYLAMGTISVGNGLFKANPSSLLAKVYDEGDSRLDGAFTMYYMAVNLGSFISMIVTPIIAVKMGYGIAFGVSAVGLAITILNFLFCQYILKGVGSPADAKKLNITSLMLVIAGSIAMCFVSMYLLQHLTVAHMALVVAGIAIIALYMKDAFSVSGVERAKMLVAFVLMLQGIVFFVLYFQMPTSLNFFAIHSVSHDVFGIAVEPEQFQALNPMWIMLASPLLAIVYGKLGEKLSMPFKFAIGMALCAISFLILQWSTYFANTNGIVGSNWLVASYAFQSIGELLVSGLGLAMVARLVPQRMMGFAMGMWFLTTATAAVLAGWVASLTAAPKGITDPQQILHTYGHVFGQIGWATAAIAAVTFIIAPKLTKVYQAKSGDEATLAKSAA